MSTATIDDNRTSEAAVPPPEPRRRFTRADLLAFGGFLLAGLVLAGRLWRDIDHRYLAFTVADQQGFEWVIATVTHAVTHGENPLFTHTINAPLGVNLMAQTSIIGLTVPLIPVTLLFGPSTTFAVILSGGLAGTAAAWYWIFSRHVVSSKVAAAVGGGLCGFATPMVSHANGGHLNYIANFLVPFIVWRVIRLREPGRWLRNGAILGLLLTWQIFIGEEPLLLTAMGVATFVVAYAVMRRDEAKAALRPFLAGLGVAAGVTLVLSGYALWYQFNGPQSYGAIPHAAKYGNDVYSLTTYGSESLGGGQPVPGSLAMNPTEENGFFGWALLLAAAVAAVWLWGRSVAARAAAVTGVVFLGLSLGTELKIHGRGTGVPGPWRLFTHVPLVGSVLPARLTFVAIPAIALLLVLGTERALAATVEPRTVRLLWIGLVVAALVPVVPTPLLAVGRQSVPQFFTAGTWRPYVGPGRSILAVPPPDGAYVQPVRWQIAADLGFNHVEGYFIGPHGPDGHGWYGAERRPTAALLNDVWRNGNAATTTEADRATAITDMRYWHVDLVVLGPDSKFAPQLRQTVESMFGPATFVGGVWIWDVRPLTA
jgi:hypothetical protein